LGALTSNLEGIMNSTILCINYILQHEAEDFFDYPSRDHIYYHATVSAYGEDEAELTLQEALDENTKTTQI